MKLVVDDCRLERMDAYTDPLNDKIKRQAEEITRLLAENAELKNGLEAIRDNAFEAGRIRGNEEAWELAHEICKPRVASDIQDMFHCLGIYEFCQLFDEPYSEIAEKFEAWERKQNEIHVGDVVTFYGKCGLVTFIDQQIRGISESGVAFVACKEDCTKTGRHIDVDAWMAQIGGER